MDIEQFAFDYGVDDLDHEEILRVVQKGVELGRLPKASLQESIPDVLARLNLLDTGRIKNAAVILFAKRDKHWVEQLNIMMARFMGLSIVDTITDNQCFYGNAFRILSEATHYAGRYLAIPEFLDADDPLPIETPRLPAIAVREAITNALVHRDYSFRSYRSRFAIYNDRIEITTSGALPSELTISDLPDNHKSYPRNSLIADVFHICGLIDKKGEGISRMIDACKDEGFPLPEFYEDARGLSLVLKFKNSMLPIDSPPRNPLRYPNNQWE